jgi:hypothetical protein
MLANAAIALAPRCRELTLVAGRRRSLTRLEKQIEKKPSVAIHLVAKDWAKRRSFLDAIKRHVKKVGAPTLTIAWVHDDELGPELAKMLADPDAPSTFIHVRGSRSALDDRKPASFLKGKRVPPNVTYRQVILGFVVEGPESRWLTHPEISAAVLAAVESETPVSVAGVLEPWSARPKEAE